MLLTALAPEASVYTISPPEQDVEILYLKFWELSFKRLNDQIGDLVER